MKLVAILEATTVTSVAKNLLDFCLCVRDMNRQARASMPIETTLLTFCRTADPVSGEPPNEFVRTARALEIPLEIINERFRFDPVVVRDLRSAVDSHHPDIIATHNLKSHFLIKFSGLHRRYRWVAFHHGYTTPDLKMRAYNRLNRWSLPSADRVITVCQPFARQLVNEGVLEKHISVLHNSIRPDAALSEERKNQDFRKQIGIDTPARLILTVGRLSREKAHMDLISAFHEMRRAAPQINATLVMVGEGPERAVLERSVRSLGLSDRILLKGHVSKVTPYYTSADVFVLPSHSEGSPYVLLEAMAARLPIVSTAVGGVPETITHEVTGLLVAPGDPKALAAAITRVLTDPQLASNLTSNAYEVILSQYSPEWYVRSLFEIYSRLISEPRASGVRAS